ncbi:hypothetical protein C8R43DRAFT_1140986 [Mycena crocata]|nr:hypothetical protein C8R43DRAFT_1140986 [Mycena crocata]
MASKIITTTDGPVTLHFQDITRVAGEMMQGRVDLNVALALEDKLEHVRIKFRGAIHTCITTSSGDSCTDHKDTVILFHTDLVLWDQGTAYPEPGSHIISCPFEFTLPQNLPPSFECWAYHRHASVGYSLEVVGDRPGLFRLNHRIRRLISVVPSASPAQLLAKETLMQGWNGPWRDFTAEKKMRKRIWGEYSHARLTLPDIASFPIATAIPFSFHIETETKSLPIHMSEGPVDKHRKPLFPALPKLSSDVKLTLFRRADVRERPGKRTEDVEDIFDLEGSLGDVTRVAAVREVINKPEWIPADEKNCGKWRRAMHYETSVAIAYAPTCSTEILDWQYTLCFAVPFSGIGNDLECNISIRLDPGLACPPPPVGAAGSSGMTYLDVLPAGPPPPMADLPPSYWNGDRHAWDLDEKKGRCGLPSI